MKFKVQRPEFLRLLRLAAPICDRKSTMPILANVLLRAESNAVTVAASDLLVTVTGNVGAKVTEPGAVTLAAKALLGIVAAFEGEEMSISSDKTNHAELKCGKSVYKLYGIGAHDFPRMPVLEDEKTASVDALALAELIDKTVFCASTDATQVHLEGINLKRFVADPEKPDEKHFRAWGFCSHRGATVTRPGAEGDALGPLDGSGIIIPRKGCLELRRLIEGAAKVELTFLQTQASHIAARVGTDVMTVQLHDAQYPNADSFLHTETPIVAVVDRAELTSALQRVGVMSTETRGVVLTLAPGQPMLVTGEDPERGDGREEVAVASFVGEGVTANLNGRYLLDLLGATLSKRVSLGFGEPLDPVVFRPVSDADKTYMGIISPMRM